MSVVNMPSDKIKYKDLSYDSSLPPFLQRLHAQKAGLGDSDRHERPIARPKRAKAHEEEDEPTVVDESGETVTKAEFDKMTANLASDGQKDSGHITGKLEADDEAMVSGAIQSDSVAPKQDQKLTDGTATKKRKAAKVIGEDEAREGKEDDDPVKDGDDSAVKKVSKKAKKKAKPIKLAFDDET